MLDRISTIFNIIYHKPAPYPWTASAAPLGLPAVHQTPTQATILLGLPKAIEAETTAEEHRVHEQQDHPPMLPSGYVKIAIENGHRNSWFSH